MIHIPIPLQSLPFVKIRSRKLSFAAFLFAFLFASCGELPLVEENEEKKAKDIYPFTSSGFVLTWKGQSEILVYIPNTAGAGFDPDVHFNEARDAFNVWKGILAKQGVNLTLTTVDGANDVEIAWFRTDSNLLGRASVNPGSNPSRRVDLAYGTTTGVFDPSVVYRIALHEFGHMFGLWSHSFSKDDVMYPSLLDLPGLSERDLETFDYAYGLTPDLNLGSLPRNTIVDPETAEGNSSPSWFAFVIECFFEGGEHPHSHSHHSEHSRAHGEAGASAVPKRAGSEADRHLDKTAAWAFP